MAGAPVTFSATASDSNGIARVEFYANAWLVATVTTPTNGQYTYTRPDMPVATYVVTAKAFDTTGLSTTSAAATLNVVHLSGASVSPASVTVGQSATVTVTGSTACAAVTIEYGDGTSDTISLPSGLPVSRTHAWSSAGTKTISATGTSGCTGQVSTTVTVTAPTSVSVTGVAVAPTSLTMNADRSASSRRSVFTNTARLAATSGRSISLGGAAPARQTEVCLAEIPAPSTTDHRSGTFLGVNNIDYLQDCT